VKLRVNLKDEGAWTYILSNFFWSSLAFLEKILKFLNFEKFLNLNSQFFTGVSYLTAADWPVMWNAVNMLN